MKIAILGWGSLVWDPRALRLAGHWMEGGPSLPIEFSRISDNGRLTLVIDEAHGVDVPTRYAWSALSDLDEAIADLQKREGSPGRNRIGFIDLASSLACERARANHPLACARILEWSTRILEWSKGQHLDAVIWTAVGPRFQERTGVPFSVEAAVRCLAGLQEPTRTLAVAYICKAPADVVTPVRTKATAELGFPMPQGFTRSRRSNAPSDRL